MKHYEISNLLHDPIVSKFVTRKWIEIDDLSSSQYSANKNIKFETSLFRTDLCDYSDGYIFYIALMAILQMGISFTNTDNASR